MVAESGNKPKYQSVEGIEPLKLWLVQERKCTEFLVKLSLGISHIAEKNQSLFPVQFLFSFRRDGVSFLDFDVHT